MKMKRKRAIGYIRVSSKHQVKGESLEVQRKAIKDYCHKEKLKLLKIYSDEGISGKSTQKRTDFLDMLHDSQFNKFDTVVVSRLARFGRNAIELLNNVEKLRKNCVNLIVIDQKIDSSTKIGNTLIYLLGMVAEMEQESIGDQATAAKYSRSVNGKPITNKPPWGRKWYAEKRMFVWLPKHKKLIQDAASDYLAGNSLREFCNNAFKNYGLKIGYQNLKTRIFPNCGDTWKNRFKNYGTVEFKMEPALSAETIEAIKEQASINRRYNRTDKKYLLTGFLRCKKCGYAAAANGKNGTYYHSVQASVRNCEKFKPVKITEIENAVFESLWEFTFDRPHFFEAAKDLEFDTDQREKLEAKKSQIESKLAEIDKKLYNLAESISKGIEPSTVKTLQDDLYLRQKKLQTDLETVIDKLTSFEDSEELREKANQKRIELQKQFKSLKRIKELSFDDKKALLNYFFSGKDKNKKPYGVYLDQHNGQLEMNLYGFITMDFGRHDELPILRKIFTMQKKLSSKDTGIIEYKYERTFLLNLTA